MGRTCPVASNETSDEQLTLVICLLEDFEPFSQLPESIFPTLQLGPSDSYWINHCGQRALRRSNVCITIRRHMTYLEPKSQNTIINGDIPKNSLKSSVE